jgi:hypothetical protein
MLVFVALRVIPSKITDRLYRHRGDAGDTSSLALLALIGDPSFAIVSANRDCAQRRDGAESSGL